MLYCDIIIKEEGNSMNKFFAVILVVATVAVSGCGATLAIEGPAVGGRSSFFGNSTVVITNNTTATVDVLRNGELLCPGVRTGQVCRDVLRNFSQRSISVGYTAIATTPNGDVVGVSERRFTISSYSRYRQARAELWTIQNLRRPR